MKNATPSLLLFHRGEPQASRGAAASAVAFVRARVAGKQGIVANTVHARTKVPEIDNLLQRWRRALIPFEPDRLVSFTALA